MRRKKYFGWEQVFESIWRNSDSDGIWKGDAASLAQDFRVSEETAESVLEELCDRRLIERIAGTYFIANWRERDEPVEANEP
jgi:hypothetical protein